MKIWQRYLFFQLASTFLFLLFCLFAIYLLIDLSIHGVRFMTYGEETSSLELIVYYFRQFSLQLDLFIPLGFLLSTLKVLFQLGANLELTALQMAGLSRKKILLPFFCFAALLTLLGLINHEFLRDAASLATDDFKLAHSKVKKKERRRDKVHTLLLEDASELVYQKYDPVRKEFSDVFWIRTDRDFWHMKWLRLESDQPMGFFADHFVRGELIEKKESFEKKHLIDMPLAKVEPKRFIPYENRPLSSLYKESKATKLPALKAHFHRKLALPLLPFFVLIGLAPHLFSFSRKKPLFLIVALSLFAFVTVMTLFDGLLILGETNVLPPILSMWCLPTILLILALPRFLKM